MFNRKIKDRIKWLENRHIELCDKQRNEYWELRNDLERLVEALNMTKEVKNIVRYVRKGGPES